MATPIEQIKEKLSIVDVAGSYIKLEKAGTNFKARCPFHNEKTPSFFISPERNTYYCFGCGAKGDIFSFVEQFEGLDFIGALRVLAERAGVELRRRDAGEGARERSEREKLFLIHEYATLFFQRQLTEHPEVIAYLHERGLTDTTIKNWRLGYAPNQWQTLSKYVQEKKITDKEIETAGLAKKSEKGKGLYDRFRGRIMFPIADAAGRIIAFSGRQFEDDGTAAKYLNSPETPLFQKSHVLYGWHKARLAIRQKGEAILVEGQMDLLACHQIGLVNTVATSGTALTAEHAALIRRLATKLIICYDADAAGLSAAARGFSLALKAGLSVVVATLPEGKDPADMAVVNPDQLVTFIENARHIIDVELERILSRVSGRERDRAIEHTIVPYIAVLDSQIEQSRFVTTVAHAAGLREELLWDVVKKTAVRISNNVQVQGTDSSLPLTIKKNRRETIERLLWGLVFLLDKRDTATALDIRKKIGIILGVPEAYQREQEMLGGKDTVLFEAETAFISDDGTIHPQVADGLLADFEEEWLREQLTIATRSGKSQDATNTLLLRLRAVHQKRSVFK